MAVLKNTKFSSKGKKNFKSNSIKNGMMNKMRGGAPKKSIVLGNSSIKKLSIFDKNGGILLNKLYSENKLLNTTLHSLNNVPLGNEYVTQPKLLSTINTEKLKMFFNYEEILGALPEICRSELGITLDAMSDFESSKFSNIEVLEKFYKTQLNKYNETIQLQKHFNIDSLAQNSLDEMIHLKIDNNKYKPEQISRLKSYSSDKSISNSKYPKLTMNNIKMFLELVKKDLEEKKEKEESEKKRLTEHFRPRSVLMQSQSRRRRRSTSKNGMKPPEKRKISNKTRKGSRNSIVLSEKSDPFEDF